MTCHDWTCKSASQNNTDRKSTRLNSSHDQISYAVFCLKKKKNRKSIRLKSSHNKISYIVFCLNKIENSEATEISSITVLECMGTHGGRVTGNVAARVDGQRWRERG